LITALVNRHYIVREDTGAVLMAEGDAGGWADFWFTNTWTGERPRVRVRYTFLDEGGATRVVGAISLATAAGLSGRASEEEASNPKAYAALQDQLNNVKFTVEGR
jgi:hypothetical protein